MKRWLMVVALVVPGAAAAQQADTAAASRAAHVQKLRAEIAGRENEPAGTVFKNVKLLANMPANRLLGIMDLGYSRSLGVGCEHCHDPAAWDSEAKPQKEVTRQMAQMAQRINRELLPAIKGLGDSPTVNCTTCHRGQVKPATNLQ